jgi:hypothetical protein
MRAFPNVNWRYLIEEQNTVSGLKEITFNYDVTWPLQVQGRTQAIDVLAYGPGYGFDELVGAFLE